MDSNYLEFLKRHLRRTSLSMKCSAFRTKSKSKNTMRGYGTNELSKMHFVRKCSNKLVKKIHRVSPKVVTNDHLVTVQDKPKRVNVIYDIYG